MLRDHSLELDERYFAPELRRKIYEEVFIDMAKASIASDIFSLGMVFFEILIGQVSDGKIDETDVRELSQESIQLNSKATDNPYGIVKRISRIIKRMIAYKSEDRYKTLSKVSEDLKHIQNQLM
jgi:serine/threonine protein kinase